jgi:hypothetical protein
MAVVLALANVDGAASTATDELKHDGTVALRLKALAKTGLTPTRTPLTLIVLPVGQVAKGASEHVSFAVVPSIEQAESDTASSTSVSRATGFFAIRPVASSRMIALNKYRFTYSPRLNV